MAGEGTTMALPGVTIGQADAPAGLTCKAVRLYEAGMIAAPPAMPRAREAVPAV